MVLIVILVVFYILKSSRKPLESHPASIFGSRPVSIENGSLAVGLFCCQNATSFADCEVL